MKKLYFLFAVVLFFVSGQAQIINFTDANFKAKLLAADPTNNIARNVAGDFIKIDSNNNGEIEINEALDVNYLFVESGQISSVVGIENFSNLEFFYCNDNSLSILNLSNLLQLKAIGCTYNSIYSLNITGLVHLEYIACSNNELNSIDITDAPNLRILNCENNNLSTINFSNSLNLVDLYCNGNQLTSINVQALSNLRRLICYDNNLSALNVLGLNNLENLEIRNNFLTSLNVSNLTNLRYLYCDNNQLTVLNIDGANALLGISCPDNMLTSINFSSLYVIEFLDINNNQITTIDVSNLPNLRILACENNLLTNLDLTQTSVRRLFCDNNALLSGIFMKNGQFTDGGQWYIRINNLPVLEYICVDEDEEDYVSDIVNTTGYANCTVNSYCSFTPGGVFYTIKGNNKYDSNQNGCDELDNLSYPRLRYDITNGTENGTLISDETGLYEIAVQMGSHTITPIIENPNYFSVDPTQVTISFPNESSPFTQNFCITPNGIHNDIEITVVSINNARPGFNANYKIIYKNKGTQTQSGAISFAFNDALLNFVNSNPAVSSQAINYLNWDFTNLQPFESREISVSLNANSPMENPPLTGGDILNFTVSANSLLADETPSDNTFSLSQTVVNSFDPNDKTCLEGNSITPEMVGKDVHYMVRFENTGTANAINVVVKDLIDMEKFDVNSLIPIAGSHQFVTRIGNTNRVEFIFENINLPFDDANNDGYVVFKIKTKPNLILGNTFSNTASIYFDYNFPIITNTATTTVALLANSDFEFEQYFKIYPNPANDILNIETKQTITVTSVNIYNTLGQVVLVIPNAQQTKSVDVSSLKTGNYFLKINSDKGSSSVKFVKM
ncbi:MAG: T9SS type A sorting domain-containing protein [Flavobacterium sp.]|nr:T9SS type A sorting domain-containing protein [Flavobacterium sp.]